MFLHAPNCTPLSTMTISVNKVPVCDSRLIVKNLCCWLWQELSWPKKVLHEIWTISCVDCWHQHCVNTFIHYHCIARQGIDFFRIEIDTSKGFILIPRFLKALQFKLAWLILWHSLGIFFLPYSLHFHLDAVASGDSWREKLGQPSLARPGQTRAGQGAAWLIVDC